MDAQEYDVLHVILRFFYEVFFLKLLKLKREEPL